MEHAGEDETGTCAGFYSKKKGLSQLQNQFTEKKVLWYCSERNETKDFSYEKTAAGEVSAAGKGILSAEQIVS